MPGRGGGGTGRGPKKNYKGRSRHFTDEETLKEQLGKEEREKQWRKKRGDDDEEEEGAEGAIKEGSGSDSSSESDSDDDKQGKKGVSHLIEIENPNRAIKKNKKVDALDNEGATGPKPQLSRKEREEVEKQQARERYQKMHMEGKTDEARNDLARLALIRKQREEAAKKREEEKLAKETSKKS